MVRHSGKDSSESAVSGRLSRLGSRPSRLLGRDLRPRKPTGCPTVVSGSNKRMGERSLGASLRGRAEPAKVKWLCGPNLDRGTFCTEPGGANSIYKPSGPAGLYLDYALRSTAEYKRME